MWTLLISLAFADLIAPKPQQDCAVGTSWQNTGGRWMCAPDSCSSDDDCDGGTCEEKSLCVASLSWSRQVGAPDPNNPPREYSATSVTGPCGEGIDCSDACETKQVCVPGDEPAGGAPEPEEEAEAAGAPAPPPPEPEPASDGCSHLSSVTGAAGAGLVLLVLATRRRDPS